MKKSPVVLLALLLVALFLAGCNSVPSPPTIVPGDQAAVELVASPGETVEPAPQPAPTDVPAP
ncbi:MAG TPA: hypothetical protein G4N94_13095, partial [Caldilineae bacterium]|nr:hypothetical protein [Caldilineae bacterium]